MISPLPQPCLRSIPELDAAPTPKFTRNACRQLINRCYGLELPVSREFAPSLVWRGSVVAGPHPVRKRLLRGLMGDLTRSLAKAEA